MQKPDAPVRPWQMPQAPARDREGAEEQGVLVEQWLAKH